MPSASTIALVVAGWLVLIAVIVAFVHAGTRKRPAIRPALPTDLAPRAAVPAQRKASPVQVIANSRPETEN